MPPVTPSAAPAPPFGAPSLANVVRIGSDPFTNGASEHATEVEPSAAAFGTTIVAAFQAGRFFTFGSSDISTATSLDGGASWIAASLPGTTHYTLPSGPYDSISDPSVAYDARHATWLVGALPVNFSSAGVPGAVVSRSPDGLAWSAPIAVTSANETDNDKDWIACDNHAASPYYGHCYIEWDNASTGLIDMAVSGDGGATWSTVSHPPGTAGGIGGQPLVLPDGTVAVVINSIDTQQIYSFTSRDGGATWSAANIVQNVTDHLPAGNLRYVPFVTAAEDGQGKIYAVWSDCRFRTNCTQNDLVSILSADGVTWSAPARIPIDPLSSSVDHFLPGLAVDGATSGSGAHVGVTYYSYANAQCTTSTCALSADFIASQDGGATWGSPQLLAGPMDLQWLASTHLGWMIGDYTAAAFVSGRPMAIAPIAVPLDGTFLQEAMYAPKAGAIAIQSSVRRSSAGEHPVPHARSDHGPRHIIP
ncbi:MAG TPA: sialidase family protein [Candidatus Baltobacteraceae bacterium]|nr:sialidase family protein [Candidatus Baltobacteraceae bacterium]